MEWQKVKDLAPFSMRFYYALRTLREMDIEHSDEHVITSLLRSAGREYVTSVNDGDRGISSVCDVFRKGASPKIVKDLVEQYPVFNGFIRVVTDGAPYLVQDLVKHILG